MGYARYVHLCYTVYDNDTRLFFPLIYLIPKTKHAGVKQNLNIHTSMHTNKDILYIFKMSKKCWNERCKKIQRFKIFGTCAAS